jgi:CBS domain-containing membrane protein
MNTWFRRYPRPWQLPLLIWGATLLALLAGMDVLTRQHPIFLIPPFGATISLLIYLPDQSVSQPLPVVVGSTMGAFAGSVAHLLFNGPWSAVAAATVVLIALARLGLYHPPQVALSIYADLLHPGLWFAWGLVFPFTLVAVGSYACCSHYITGWPQYPRRIAHDISRPS